MKSNFTKKAAQVVIIHPETGKILGVSRKNDPNDYGLVGGKVDLYDLTPEDAAVRETLEETGIKLNKNDLKLIHNEMWGEREQYTYLAPSYDGSKLFTKEAGVIKWCTLEEILQGSFSEYNKIILEKLNLV